MASGKTTLAVAIAAAILQLILEGKLPAGTQLLFVCNVVEVRGKVATDCWNAGIPFALTRLSKTGKAVITNHKMTKKDESRLVVVASPETAIQLLEKDPEKYILYYDEPTCTAGKRHLPPDPNAKEVETSDEPNSKHQPEEAIARLWSIFPNRTILGSATLPLPEKLPTVLGPHLKKYPNMHIEVQITQEIPIAATFHTFDGKLVRLHDTCETKQQLERYIEQCKIDPQLGKMLSYPIANQLRDSMNANKIDGVPDMRKRFSQIDNMTANNVRQVCIEMLELASNQSDEQIKKICSHTDRQYDTGSVDFANLGTTGAGKFTHMTLVATNDPIKFAKEAFGSLIKDIQKAGINIADYRKFIADYEARMTEYKKNKASEEKRAGEKKKSTSDGHRFEKETPGDNDCGGNIPKLQWPSRFQVNTPLHVEQYGSTHRISSENMRSNIDINQLPLLELKDTDSLLVFLLFCRIGLIAPELIKDPVYNFEVSKCAKAGDFAFVICDGSIACGTNWSNLRTVIVMPDFPINHSFNTLKQVMGRAGRAGKSPTATIYVDSATVQLLRDCAMNPENLDGDLEAQNINRAIICLSIRDYWKNRAELKKREYELQRSREVDAQLIARARYLTRNMDHTLNQIEAREAKQREEADENKTNWRSQGLRDPAPKTVVSWESHAAEFAAWRNKPDVPERSEPNPLAQSTGLDVSRKMGNSIPSYCERCNTDGMFGMKCCCGGYFMPKKAESWRNKPDAPQRSDPSPLAQSTGLKYVPPQQRQTQEPNPHKWRDQCTESKCIERTPETAPDTNRNFSGLRNKLDAPQSSSTSSGSESKCVEKTPETAPDTNRNFSGLRNKPDAPQSSSTSSGSEAKPLAKSTGKYVPPSMRR